MNILCIVADIDPQNLGGAEWHFVEVLKRLSPKLDRADLLVGPNDQIANSFNNYRISVIPTNYPHITNLYGVIFILFSLPKALSLCIKNKYDLIWAKQEFPQGVVGVIVHLIFKIPLYVTSQSASLNKNELVVKGNFSPVIKKFLTDSLTPIIGFVFKNCNQVGAVSKFSSQQALILGAKKVSIIPNGIDLSLYKIKKPKHKDSKFQIVTTSSLIERNAVDILIQACFLLPATINWNLKIAGDGVLKSELEILVKKLKIVNRVKFLGRVANSKIPKLLNESQVFVRVSRAEGFGSSFIEAMATKVPVIATPVGGIVDFVNNNVTGLLVKVDSPVELSKSIVRLYNQPRLRQKLITNSYNLMRKKYNWDMIASKVFTLWEQMLINEK